jgi:hypothetical protein
MDAYSYCSSRDICVANIGNYIDNKCSSHWRKGKKLSLINDCAASVTTCPSFTSSDTSYGQWSNTTNSLASTEYCNITVDAT